MLKAGTLGSWSWLTADSGIFQDGETGEHDCFTAVLCHISLSTCVISVTPQVAVCPPLQHFGTSLQPWALVIIHCAGKHRNAILAPWLFERWQETVLSLPVSPAPLSDCLLSRRAEACTRTGSQPCSTAQPGRTHGARDEAFGHCLWILLSVRHGRVNSACTWGSIPLAALLIFHKCLRIDKGQ